MGAVTAHDADVFHIATLVIERHGGDAANWAYQRTREFLFEEDVTGVALWTAIQDVIEKLQRH